MHTLRGLVNFLLLVEVHFNYLIMRQIITLHNCWGLSHPWVLLASTPSFWKTQKKREPNIQTCRTFRNRRSWCRHKNHNCKWSETTSFEHKKLTESDHWTQSFCSQLSSFSLRVHQRKSSRHDRWFVEQYASRLARTIESNLWYLSEEKLKLIL